MYSPAWLERHLAALYRDVDGAPGAAAHALLVDELLHLLLVPCHLLLCCLQHDTTSIYYTYIPTYSIISIQYAGYTHPRHVDVAGTLGSVHVVLVAGEGDPRARHPPSLAGAGGALGGRRRGAGGGRGAPRPPRHRLVARLPLLARQSCSYNELHLSKQSRTM